MVQRRHRKRYEHGGDARYLTFSCFQRLSLFSNDQVKEAFVVHLEECHKHERFQLIAWVVMPEHVHLLLVPAVEQTVSGILRAIKEPFARSTLLRWRELDAPILTRLIDSRGSQRFWQRGGGYDRNIISDDEVVEKIEYIHANPVRRGLVQDGLEWRWSSARWYSGDCSSAVQIDPFSL